MLLNAHLSRGRIKRNLLQIRRVISMI